MARVVPQSIFVHDFGLLVGSQLDSIDNIIDLLGHHVRSLPWPLQLGA